MPLKLTASCIRVMRVISEKATLTPSGLFFTKKLKQR